MKVERSERVNLFYWFIVMLFALLVMSSLVSAATTTITAPSKVTRGGVVNEGTDPVLGSFNITVTNSSSSTVDPWYYIGFTINPQNMTGGYCDRAAIF